MTTTTRREFLERFRHSIVGLAAGQAVFGSAGPLAAAGGKVFRAGANAMDITPTWFPVVVNGGFQPKYAKKAHDPLHARCLVLDDGSTRVAIVVVDSCLMDRALMDEAKRLAQKLTGIPAERMFISTTHTHSAPAAVGALGNDADEKYRKWVPGRIAQGIHQAQKNLAPARIGWKIGQLPELAQSRRWITRPDKMLVDPFGRRTTRATMHPGYRNPNYEEPSGPMDPSVSVVAVQSPEGKPIALLAAYSIHYVGSPALSADYFGVFAEKIAQMVGPGDPRRPFVGILANGTSGDAYIRDYSGVPKKYDMHQVADAVAKVALEAYKSMKMHDWVPLVIRQRELELAVRKPKLEWAKKLLAKMEGRPPKTGSEVYAREQLILSRMPPVRTMKLEALRIGELGIVGIPAEVFAITGLKVRRRSPLQPTFTISLANGWDGYLPPPEQMAMGGYTTWLARSSCLEAEAEPKVVAAVMGLLDEVAGDARATPKSTPPPYAAAVLASKPLAYLRLDEMNGPHAHDAAGRRELGTFETQIAYFMPGPRPPKFPGLEPDNRAPHFVGQRLKVELANLRSAYSVELWFYNAMPADARAVTGYLFSRGPDGAEGAPGDHLGIGGITTGQGKLFFYNGDAQRVILLGKTPIAIRSWNHVVLVRLNDQVTVYLNGDPSPELAGQAAGTAAGGTADLFLGGRNDNFANFEGKIDEVALYDRVLPADEIARHYQAAAKL